MEDVEGEYGGRADEVRYVCDRESWTDEGEG